MAGQRTLSALKWVKQMFDRWNALIEQVKKDKAASGTDAAARKKSGGASPTRSRATKKGGDADVEQSSLKSN